MFGLQDLQDETAHNDARASWTGLVAESSCIAPY
jgi:hypothetical protein